MPVPTHPTTLVVYCGMGGAEPKLQAVPVQVQVPQMRHHRRRHRDHCALGVHRMRGPLVSSVVTTLPVGGPDIGLQTKLQNHLPLRPAPSCLSPVPLQWKVVQTRQWTKAILFALAPSQTFAVVAERGKSSEVLNLNKGFLTVLGQDMLTNYDEEVGLPAELRDGEVVSCLDAWVECAPGR